MFETYTKSVRLADQVSEKARERAFHVELEIRNLFNFTNDVAAAFSLFDTLRNQPSGGENEIKPGMLLAWQFVAARDGAVSIYNFAECMEGIKQQLHAEKELEKLVDWDANRIVMNDFKATFPSYETLRHGVAHSGELTKSPKQRQRNELRDDFEGLGLKIEDSVGMIKNGFYNRTFYTTHRGRIRSYDVTRETYETLKSIRDRFIGTIKHTLV